MCIHRQTLAAQGSLCKELLISVQIYRFYAERGYKISPFLRFLYLYLQITAIVYIFIVT